MPDIRTPVAPVRKTVTVPIPPARAFEVFTGEIGSWWPVATHSVGLEHATSVLMGTNVGDQVVEQMDDGTTSVWGTLIRFDPAARARPHVARRASRPRTRRFLRSDSPLPPTARSSSLVHSGLERWENGEATANDYLEGWDAVLSRFQVRAGRSLA